MLTVGTKTAEWWRENIGQHTCTYVPNLESTQVEAKKNHHLSKSIKEPYLFVCDIQDSGLGRGENSWSNPQAGTALLSSFIFKTTGAPQPITTPLFGWAVFKSLEKAFPEKTLSLKAPNDIYLGSKKVAGLLLDSVSQGESHYLIFGLGVNVSEAPEDVDHATHLNAEGSKVTKDQWKVFLQELYSLLKIVSVDCLKDHLQEPALSDLEAALKKYPENKIEKFKSDGSLVLESGEELHWRQL